MQDVIIITINQEGTPPSEWHLETIMTNFVVFTNELFSQDVFVGRRSSVVRDYSARLSIKDHGFSPSAAVSKHGQFHSPHFAPVHSAA